MTKVRWQTLVIRDAEGDEVKGEAKITALNEWMRTGGINGMFFDRLCLAHEVEDDASTWGPPVAERDVDWTGYPG